MTELDIFLRLGLAALAGIVLGVDRELRGIAAGLRTHAVVALSSAAITVSAFLIHDQLVAENPSQGADPLRVIQGLAQAIGFIAAGAIFVSKGDVHNLTSAANLWLASAAGIAAGAGQYFLVAVTLGLGIVVVTGVRLIEKVIPLSSKSRND
jgi:putative Mg2+ transporter-C (MgtC) family protein